MNPTGAPGIGDAVRAVDREASRDVVARRDVPPVMAAVLRDASVPAASRDLPAGALQSSSSSLWLIDLAITRASATTAAWRSSGVNASQVVSGITGLSDSRLSCTRDLLLNGPAIIPARPLRGGGSARPRPPWRAAGPTANRSFPPRRRLSDGGQVGPRRRDQALRAIRQDQAQLEAAVTAHPAQHRQRLALERVAGRTMRTVVGRSRRWAVCRPLVRRDRPHGPHGPGATSGRGQACPEPGEGVPQSWRPLRGRHQPGHRHRHSPRRHPVAAAGQHRPVGPRRSLRRDVAERDGHTHRSGSDAEARVYPTTG